MSGSFEMRLMATLRSAGIDVPLLGLFDTNNAAMFEHVWTGPDDELAIRGSTIEIRYRFDRGSRLEVNRHLLEPLTERELAVLDYLPSRLGNSELSAALFVSVNTVKTHLRNIYRKLDAPDRDAAVARARERGLL